jgi:inner membrane protein
MASLGHIAVGLAAGRAFDPNPKLARRAAIAFTLVSLWPDADAIAFVFKIPYSHPFGHRGATHSLVVALLVGLASALVAKSRGLDVRRTVLFTTVVAASHGLLDTITYGGGRGCALLWPFSDARFWAPEPMRILPIAPIGLDLLSIGRLYVMAIELVFFLPFWIYAFRKKK